MNAVSFNFFLRILPFLFLLVSAGCVGKSQSNASSKSQNESNKANSTAQLTITEELVSLSPFVRTNGLKKLCVAEPKSCSKKSLPFIDDIDPMVRSQSYLNLAKVRYYKAFPLLVKKIPEANYQELFGISEYFASTSNKSYALFLDYYNELHDWQRPSFDKFIRVSPSSFAQYIIDKCKATRQKDIILFMILAKTNMNVEAINYFLSNLKDHIAGSIAAKYLSKTKNKQVVNTLNRLLSNEIRTQGDDIFILRIISILGEIGDKESMSILQKLSQNRNAVIKQGALQSIYKLLNDQNN